MPTAAELITKIEAHGVDAYVRDMHKAEQATDKTARNMDTAGTKAGGLASNLAKIGGAAALGGIAGIGVGLGSAVKVASDFESSLNGVSAATGATSDQMALMRAEALKIGADTSKGASEAVEAMGELTKSGVSVQDAVGGVARTVVQMSEASGSTVERMATLMSDSLNVFNIGAAESGNVANTLVKAAGASSISIDDLGQSLSAGGLVAKNAGLNIDQFSTAIGIMGNQGLKGSDAGTSLKAMIAGLTPVTDKAAGVMADLGIEVFDAQGNFKAFPDILSELSSGFHGLTEEQRANAAETLFGSDGIRAFNALVPDTASGLADAATQFQEFTNAMGEAPSVADQSAKRLEGLGGQIEILKGSLETIAIEVGSALLPALTTMTAFLAEKLPGAFETAKSAVSTAVAVFQTIAGAIQSFAQTGPITALGAALGVAFGFIADNKEVLVGVAATIATVMVPAIIAWTAATWAQVTAQTAAAAAFVVANAPLILLAASIGLVVAGIVLLVRHWDEIVEKFPIAGAIVDELVVSFQNFAAWITNAGQAILDANIGEKITAAFNWLVDFNLAEKAAEWFGGLWTGIQEKWDEGVSFLTNLGTSIVEAIGDLTSTLWQQGQDLITGLVRGYVELWTTEVLFFVNLGTAILTAIGSFLETLVQTGKDLITGFYGGVTFVWDTSVTFFTALGATIITAIGSFLLTLVQHGKDLIGGLWSGIQAIWTAEKQGINFFLGLAQTIVGAVGSLVSTLSGAGRDLIQGFINGVNELWNSAISFVGDLFDGVIGAVKEKLGIASPSTVMFDAGKNFIQGFIDGTGSMAGALKDFIVGLATQAFDKFKETAGGVIGAVGGAISGAAGAVGGALGIGGGSGSPDQVPIERTSPDGRIGYAPGAVTLSEGQVRGLVNEAMAITGIQMSPSEYEGYINRLRNESGFNTGVVNLWDVNARNGTPSIGIGQTIGPTFRGNALPGYGDILNPLHNIIASLRYIRARYPGGAPPPLPGVPYAKGGGVADGLFTVGERGFEVGYKRGNQVHIFSNEQSRALLSGMSGGARVPGFAAGSFGQPDQFAAAIASPGGWTPDLAAAYFAGMKFIAEGMQAEADAIMAGMRMMGDGMSNFSAVVMQQGFGISPNQGEGPSTSMSNFIPADLSRMLALQRQAGNRGMGGQALDIVTRYYDGRITLAAAIKALEALLTSGGTGGRVERITGMRENWQGSSGGGAAVVIDYDRLGEAVAAALQRNPPRATIDGEQVYRHTSDRLMRDSSKIVGRRG